LINSEIITIGDEILIGQIVNTNTVWIAQQLNSIGVNVFRMTSIGDSKEIITRTLNKALEDTDIVIITGGLGPTNDDITKNTLADYFDSKLVENKDVLADLKTFLKLRGVKEISKSNYSQCLVPDNCEIIRNIEGTAPGMIFKKNNKLIISLPGVPFEMKLMIENNVFPLLKQKIKLPTIIHKTINTQGIAESKLSEVISDWEKALPSELKLAYLPSPGLVRLRLTANGNNYNDLQQKIEDEVKKLQLIISEYIFGFDDDSLELIIGKLLKNNKFTLSTAESCTGGAIAQLITSVSGSSEYFIGSIISYSNEVKINELGVIEQDLITYGAVSKEVVEQMAIGVKKKLKTDFSIAVSGIAGPTGGTEDKPVGTTWIAVASENKVISKKFQFGDNRLRNIERAKISALNMLKKLIENY